MCLVPAVGTGGRAASTSCSNPRSALAPPCTAALLCKHTCHPTRRRSSARCFLQKAARLSANHDARFAPRRSQTPRERVEITSSAHRVRRTRAIVQLRGRFSPTFLRGWTGRERLGWRRGPWGGPGRLQRAQRIPPASEEHGTDG